MISKEDHPTVFTEVCLLNDGEVSGQNIGLPWVDQPDGGVQERVRHMLVEDPVEVIKLAEHCPVSCGRTWGLCVNSLMQKMMFKKRKKKTKDPTKVLNSALSLLAAARPKAMKRYGAATTC